MTEILTFRITKLYFWFCRLYIFEYENSDEYTNRRENYCEIIIEDEPEIITEEEFCDILKIIHTKLDEKLFSKFAKSK